ncbi:hypothetical protein [Mesorhizobium sp.]|uniref:hypothetical protein n=1 Tax=Mesorhizobium sp. TaxID=1871066 RepID=UPI000FE41042|nr:hypothetical protein [Mesorhizobium sp.]RWJ03447.1 MAG: hypothetical protein EOR24_32210 [Mesorhizobium sp.]
MNRSWHIQLYRKGLAREPTHTESFIGSEREAKDRLLAVWDTHKPVDELDYRATLFPAGSSRLTTSIEEK